MARQPLLKLATSDVHAANLIDKGVLKDFTIVFIKSKFKLVILDSVED